MENQINIVNVNLVLPNEIAENTCIALEDGLISRIDSTSSHGDVIDAEGGYLMPGFIDIHSDHIEQVIEPRPGTFMDIAFALREQEKQLINNGITTMYQSLSMWKPIISSTKKKTLRESDGLEKVVREIANASKASRLINHRLHIRFDITNIEAVPELMDMLASGDVALLSFMDHTPGQGQYRDIEEAKASIKAYNSSYGEEEVERLFQARMNVKKLPDETLIEIAKFANSMGVAIASHDDDSTEKVDFVKNSLRATISEFPVELGVARYATQAGMETLGGAANVLMGKSHSGNLSATEGILDGCISMLCSDYYPPSMMQAVFKLHRDFDMPLYDCVNLVTSAPARALGIYEEVGSIAEGKVADLILVDGSGSHPNITTAIKRGAVMSVLNHPKLHAAARRS